ncbi:ABC transporter ATP-binding protein NatA [Lachnospiraceae bacterium]|jgi:ABC-2 type transport system ATP-binding protein|nr:ATP-binding cassette domain-containing protein [Eubacterium sp.]GFI28568.1 ABC transporter ATP-binding protein NatA [Lachnospiraceae bacterium]
MRLELKNITKSFGEKEVLKGISFSADSGRAFGLLGRNGAGKTTTIRILMDVFGADSGEIFIDGTPIRAREVSIGYLPEERGLYPKKKIIDQLVYFARLHGMKQQDAVKSVDYWLGRLGMEEHRGKRLDTLSKGNQQKIQLVTALAHNPQIVILDEPFSGLDPVNAMLLKDVVKEEIQKGKIVLFSSHQMNYIEEFCDSIAILNGGSVVLRGDIQEIKHNYVRDKLVVRSEEADKILSDFASCCTRKEGGGLLLKLSSADEKQNMMKHLTETYDIDEVKVFEPSLNDIFVEYTKDRNEEAGE